MEDVHIFRQIGPVDRAKLLCVLHKSFRTIAEEFSFSKESNPKHGSFITNEDLNRLIVNGLEIFGYYENTELIGCVGIRQGEMDNAFNIEKLGVLPERRYEGIGRAIMKYAMEEIKMRGGKLVYIGLINKNEKLKNWYKNLGFIEYEVKEVKNLPFACRGSRLFPRRVMVIPPRVFSTLAPS